MYKGLYKEIPSFLQANIFKDIDLFSFSNHGQPHTKRLKLRYE